MRSYAGQPFGRTLTSTLTKQEVTVAYAVIMAGGWSEKIDLAVEKNMLRPVAEAILDDMKRGCPKDTWELHNSLGMAIRGNVARIGSTLDRSVFTEMGTKPHIIRSHGNYPLRNKATGEVFGRVVHHPGTPAEPFMRRALYRRRSG